MPHSESLKVFWFTPIRSGTRSVEEIMRYFKFSNLPSHNFYEEEFQKKFFLISNVRNPYARLFSIYNLFCVHSNKQPNNFKLWAFKKLKEEVADFDRGLNYQTNLATNYFEKSKYPDYVVRIESFEKDIRNIWFIKENMTEELESIIQENVVRNMYSDEFNLTKSWEEYYDEELAEFVYNFLEKDFLHFGYNKNSWKNGTP